MEESKTTQTERPVHYKYLKEFRVHQCTNFPLHKCLAHRPFTCFNWHFPNQRRRRPLRRRDGTFNYSPDVYCNGYDETNGVCAEGDDCPFLHRTAGDTERRYHLRYYKTCMCVYETDARGSCTKNGAHCAFAHGDTDKRPPVYDAKEQQQDKEEEPAAQNQLDKERMVVDDPKWQDANYVLLHYKTEQCRRPPRICRQGYACPQFHNYRDKRRSPLEFKYRSTPCPNVKHGDEWGEPSTCAELEECSYCHTRTEQQFHPEIYKSTKCHDMATSAYCPRGPFCAFAHADSEMTINRNINDKSLLDIIQVLSPPTLESNNNYTPDNSYSSVVQQQQQQQGESSSHVLLMGSSLMDSLMGEGAGEGYCLFPVKQVGEGRGGEERFGGQQREEQRETTPPTPPSPTPHFHNSPPPWPDNPFGLFPPQEPAPPQQPPALFPAFDVIGHRGQDLTYLSLAMLKQCSATLGAQLEAVNKAILSHNKDSPHYPCLSCKQRDAYRSVVLVPCDHQVVCTACAPTLVFCPLCQAPIRNRKTC